MKKIVLHIGMHKTGSTSIQAALDGYRDEVFEYASLPPVIEAVRDEAFIHALPMSVAFDRDPSKIVHLSGRGFNALDVESIRKRCQNDLRKCLATSEAEVLIISAESVTNFDHEITRQLSDLFHQYSSEVEVFAYVRDPFDYIKSITQEVIKWGYSNGQLFPFSYRENFESVEKVFGAGKVNYRLFRRSELKDGDVVADFRDWVGLMDESIDSHAKNISMSTNAVRCMFALNGSSISTFGNELLYSSRSEFQNVAARLFPGKFDVPNHLVAHEIDVWDMAWMETRLGQRLAIPPHSDEHLDVLDLKDWMGMVSVGMIDRICAELTDRGAQVARYLSFTELVNQLYLECVRSVSGAQFDYRAFSSHRYLEKYADVRRSGMHPFCHYVLYGHSEGRDDT